MSLRYEARRIWQLQEAVVMNLRERKFVLTSLGSAVCHNEEGSFQEGEGERQPDTRVHGQGCVMWWDTCVLAVSSLGKSPHLSEFPFCPCTKWEPKQFLL